MRSRHLALALLLAACGSSSTPGGGPDAQVAGLADAPRSGDAAAAACQMSWLEDGAPRCSNGSIAVLGVSTTDDSLDVAGVDIPSGGTGIDLIVGGAHPFTAPQTFDCANPQPHSIAEMTYTPPGLTGTATSCSVTVTAVGAVGGANATGTFSGVISISGGGTRTISGGTFDVPRRQ